MISVYFLDWVFLVVFVTIDLLLVTVMVVSLTPEKKQNRDWVSAVFSVFAILITALPIFNSAERLFPSIFNP